MRPTVAERSVDGLPQQLPEPSRRGRADFCRDCTCRAESVRCPRMSLDVLKCPSLAWKAPSRLERQVASGVEIACAVDRSASFARNLIRQVSPTCRMKFPDTSCVIADRCRMRRIRTSTAWRPKSNNAAKGEPPVPAPCTMQLAVPQLGCREQRVGTRLLGQAARRALSDPIGLGPIGRQAGIRQ